MTQRDSPPGPKQYRLGLLTLVAEPSVPAARFESWLPRAAEVRGQRAEIEIWLGDSEKRETAGGSSRLVSGGVAVWIDETARRASLRSPTGFAELDLGERWGQVTPRDGTSELHSLLTVSCAILFGRAGAAMVDASAIVDLSGGGWLIVGPREDRAALVSAFVADGCDYVSDDQVVVRRATHQAGLIVIESWHRATGALAPERWTPVAQLRGVLLARGLVTKAPMPWRQASRDQTLASLCDASPHLHTDPATVEPLRELLASCAARPVITALLNRDRATPPGGAVKQLQSAVDAML
jgi:hypothetical protein